MQNRIRHLFLLLLVLAACSSLAASGQNTPVVERVEPPSWWANHTINPVRVMARAANVDGLELRPIRKGIVIGNVKLTERGDYIFFDVTIAKNAKPGKYPIELFSKTGKTEIPFEINQPLDSNTNFQGVTSDDVIYLIMPDRFANGDASNDNPKNSEAAANNRRNPRAWHGGDFLGIKNNLPYLKELGITAIWLTPWYDNSNEINYCDQPWCPATSYHGYGATDYYQTEDHFGTLSELRELVAAAHKQGIKVVQDQFANHVGSRHVWLKSAPLGNWFSKFEKNTFNNSVLLSPNASPAERNNLLHGWFDEGLPDLNQNEPEAAKYLIQNAVWWIGMTGVDGIRQDTIQYMPRPFIREWSTAIKKQYPRFWMVGEVFETDSAQTAFFQGGKTGWDNVDTNLPAVFDFNLWRTSFDVFTNKKPVRALRDVLKYDGLYPNINNVVTLSGNHDTDRFMSLDGATLAGAKLHLAFLLTTRGIPQIYYGEELGMRGAHDPDNRRDFPGGWREDTKSAFTRAGRTPEEQEMFEWTQKWLRLRRENNALKAGQTIDLHYDNDVYIFARQVGGFSGIAQTMLLTFNRSNEAKRVLLNDNSLLKQFADAGKIQVAKDEKRVSYLTVPAKSAQSYYIEIRY